MATKDGPIGGQKVGAKAERTLYLVDIENMVGCSELTLSDVAKVQHRINTAISPRQGDHTVIATSHHNSEAMMFGWRGSAERKIRSGQDGADLALLECVNDVGWIAERYERVVIASGDHAFTFAIISLRNAGMKTLVVAPDVGCSGAVRRAAGADIVPLGSAHPNNVVAIFPTSKDAA